MNIIIGLFSNYYLQCTFMGWFFAQTLKFLICLILYRKAVFSLFFSSGGMPSSHSASVCALVASIAKIEGVSSSLFAVAFLFAFIVMYDASGVRRASGEHARIINRLVQNITDKDQIGMDKSLKELIGHTPLEVIAGACLGVFIVFIY